MSIITTIYLDNNSTTRVDDRVLSSMLPYFTEFYGNASSSHDLGTVGNSAVKTARSQLATLLGAESHEITFTSGATEAINLAIRSVTPNNGGHIITCATEHPAVIETCKAMEKTGTEVTILGVDAEGLINLDTLKSSIKENTCLICIMWGNNETGVIQPIKEISLIAHERNVLFMCDGTQAIGRINKIDVNALGIDLLCLSGHKFYGPKGVGALFHRSRRPFKARLSPLLYGGGQENGLRSGTLNVPGIVGIGVAAELILKNAGQEISRIEKLRNELEASLMQIPGTKINGQKKKRLINTLSVSFEGVDADALVVALKNISVSNGSACSSTSIKPSHVLKAMGLTDSEAFSTLRFSLGRFNTKEEIKETAKVVSEKVCELRMMSVS